MIFQTRSKTIIICHYDNGLNVNPTSFHFPDILYSPVLSPKSLQLVSRASNEQNSGFYMKFFLHFFSSPQFYFISFGEISGTFRKVAICNNHCPISFVISNRTNNFLNSRNSHISLIAFCLNNNLFSPFAKNKICSIVVAITCECNMITEMPELDSEITFLRYIHEHTDPNEELRVL